MSSGLDPFFACTDRSTVSSVEFAMAMFAGQLYLVNRSKYPSIKSKISELSKLPQYNLQLNSKGTFLEKVLRGIKKNLGSTTTLRYPLSAPLMAIWINLFGDLPLAIQAKSATVVAVFGCFRQSEYLVDSAPNDRTLRLENLSYPIESRSPGLGKKCFTKDDVGRNAD